LIIKRREQCRRKEPSSNCRQTSKLLVISKILWTKPRVKNVTLEGQLRMLK